MSPNGSGRAGTIAAAAATLTAIVAVVIALWDNVQTRRHNRLSVLPYVVIERLQQDSAGVVRGVLTLSNEGVGPAMLNGLDIRVPLADGRDSAVTTWAEAAPLILARGIQIRGWLDVDSGSALGVQRSAVLLRVQAAGEDAGTRIQALFDGFRLRLRYASVYGDAATESFGEWPAAQ